MDTKLAKSSTMLTRGPSRATAEYWSDPRKRLVTIPSMIVATTPVIWVKIMTIAAVRNMLAMTSFSFLFPIMGMRKQLLSMIYPIIPADIACPVSR